MFYKGYSHVFITKILADLKNPNLQIFVYHLFNNWDNEQTIDNMIIINDPRDAEESQKCMLRRPYFQTITEH